MKTKREEIKELKATIAQQSIVLYWIEKNLVHENSSNLIEKLLRYEKALSEIACDACNDCGNCQLDMEIARKALGKKS